MRSTIVGWAAGSVLVCATACGPDITEPWQILEPIDLGMTLSLGTPGAFSVPLPDPGSRPYHQVLPLDELLVTPSVAGLDGLIPLEDLEFRYVVCSATGCGEALNRADGDLPVCASTGAAEIPCVMSADPTPTGSFVVPTFTEATPDDPGAAFPTSGVAAIGSRTGAPGADVCVARLRDRAPLGGCFVLFRSLSFGPQGTFLELLEESGADIDLDDISEAALAAPRNRVPQVDAVTITVGTNAGTAAPGSTINVSTGDTVRMQWVPSDDDFDEYSVFTEEGDELRISDLLLGAWWTTDDATAFDVDLTSGTSVEWVVGNEPGTKYVYLLVRDASAAESVAWFRFDVSQG
ncbi:MAG: hypothetical protein AAGA54_02125 [Myxococcota bacterium]